MDTELKNKWTELIEASFYGGRDAYDQNQQIKCTDLPQNKKDLIFDKFMDEFIKDWSTTCGYNRLQDFVTDATLDSLPKYDFDFLLTDHRINIYGVLMYGVYAVLYNWPELFNRILTEINDYIIKFVTKDKNLDLSYTLIIREELKELLRYMLDEISKLPDFEILYNELVLPYRLK